MPIDRADSHNPTGGHPTDRFPWIKARTVEVIEIELSEGKGENDTDPVRTVIYYIDTDGRMLARQDDWEQKCFEDWKRQHNQTPSERVDEVLGATVASNAMYRVEKAYTKGDSMWERVIRVGKRMISGIRRTG